VAAKLEVEAAWEQMNPPELFPQPAFPSEPLDVFHVPLGATMVPLKVSELPILKSTALISGFVAFVESIVRVTLHTLPVQLADNI
jgi:hypothetical protein